MYSWSWDWTGGWSAVVGVVFGLAIFILPFVFFLLNLRALLERVSDRNRAMQPDYVWLNFIPIFNLGWFIYTVVKVRDSVRAEYHSRGWLAEGDFGYNVGLTAGILSICSAILGWLPVIGFGLGIAWLVCWIIYWLKTNDLRNRLGVREVWSGAASPPPYSRPGVPMGQAPMGGAPMGRPPVAWPPAAAAGATSGPRERVAYCGACGATILAGDRFCRVCGLPLPRPMSAAPESAGAEPAEEDPQISSV
jgi:hypothetical protein